MKIPKFAHPFLKLAHNVYSIRARLGRRAGLGVRIMLIKDGQVMLVKHTYQVHWYMPGGGVKHRETPMKAAIREAYEEVGAQINGEPELLGIYSNFREGKNDHTLLFVTSDFTMGKATDTWEIAERGFFPIHDLPADVSPGTNRRIQEYLNGKRAVASMW